MADKTNADLPILIIGAGVAGLTLAQGLRLRSIPFRLFERHPQSYSLQGHRFRIFKDCLAALDTVLSPRCQDLFLRTGAERPSVEPRYIDAKSLSFPPRTATKDTKAAPKPIDRSWIRMLMTLGIEDAIEYEKVFSSYEIDAAGVVQVLFLDGSSVRGRLLVGADGINSRVRARLQPNRRLLDLERWIMWGRTPLTDNLRAQLPEDVCTWFMAFDRDTNAQVIIEPILWSESSKKVSAGLLPDFENYIYWVLSKGRNYSQELPKSGEDRKRLLQEVTETWHPSLQLVLNSASHEQSACAPVLSSKPDIEMNSSSQTGKVTLIGDAAHPMSPMGGSGADTAMHSAIDLAVAIGNNSVSENGIGAFHAKMEVRAREKILHSFKNGQTYWQGKEWSDYKEMDL